ncbi:MAG TPA: DUF5668 domain-containing protein [Mucilaginibacter sp.]|jgi:hypothetical protein|nr:DUF5668 domain-containing protein [Mucilaginibacter sp.]
MRNDKLIPGMILVMIGAIFLLHNFGYIHFHWINLIHLWPIFLVIGGVNLVFANNKSTWATILKISVVIAGFALLVFGNFNDRYSRWWWPHYTYHNDDNNNDADDNNDDDNNNDGKMVKVQGNSTFNDPYNATIKAAQLNISGGATSYQLSDTTNQLFSAVTKETFGGYEMNHHQEDSVYVVDFKMKDDHNGFNFHSDNNDNGNRVDIKLNPNPVWNVKLDAGATDVNFDLSKFKIRTIKLSGGAGSFALKLGQPLTSTDINISTGAASVKFTIPQNAACRITKSSAFSSDDFEGFIKKNDGDYETPNFDAAKNKFYIHFSGAMSGFEVKRY